MKRILSCLVVATVVGGLWVSGVLEPLERSLLDLRQDLDRREASGRLLLVAMDGKSAAALGRRPWPRSHLGTVVENLLEAGGERVVLDVDLGSRTVMEEDRQLAATLTETGRRVVLPLRDLDAEDAVGSRNGNDDDGTERVPLPTLRRHAALARAGARRDPDGVTRRYAGSAGASWPTVAGLLAPDRSGDEGFYIDFSIDPSSIPVLSFVDVLSGRFTGDAARDRVVLVGPTVAELTPGRAVPRGAALSDVLLEALAYESLVQHRALRRTGSGFDAVLLLLLAFVVGPLLVDRPWRGALLVGGVAAGSLWAVALIVQRVSPRLIDVAPGLALLAGCVAWGQAMRLQRPLVARLLEMRRHRRDEALVRQVVEHSFDAILVLDRKGRVESFNRAAEAMFGHRRDGARGRDAGEFVLLPDSADRGESALAFAAGLYGLQEAIGVRQDGGEFPVEVASASTVVQGEPKRVMFVRDISVRKAQQRALEHQALHDALTELPNRFLLRQRLDEALQAARRDGGELAFLMLDMNRFKEINDTLGHHMGDRLLRSIATRVRTALRPADIVARFGGDEFAVLLPRADEEAALRVARRLARVLQAPFRLDGMVLHVDAAVGISLFPRDAVDGAMLLQRADVAMYAAKRSGNGIQLYDEDHDQVSLRRLTLAGELRAAIENHELRLVYQPKISAAHDRVTGVEALLRWQHTRYGHVPPDEFIALAEQSGMIRPLTRLVFATALRQCASWNGTGLRLEISVNVSAHNLLDEHLPSELERLLEDTGVPAEQLTLEVTESVIMEDPQRALSVATALRALGINISIDDFGIGYSSLGYLKKLPARELKIDRSFVMEMDRNLDDATIVRSTIELAHNLGLRVVAEGVEREEIWQSLKEQGCDTGQGYLFSRPLAPERLEAFLREQATAKQTGQGAETDEESYVVPS
jgi:diguanylate cyclase (GGDEF)-like protein/PAS domain S-box-containing protein